jgi:hypothetical protein
VWCLAALTAEDIVAAEVGLAATYEREDIHAQVFELGSSCCRDDGWFRQRSRG